MCIVTCDIGMGPMPWTVNSEIYPLWARSTGNACSAGVNWICNVLVSLTFLHVAQYLTYYGTTQWQWLFNYLNILLFKKVFSSSQRSVLLVLQSGCAGLCLRGRVSAGDQRAAIGGDRVSVQQETLHLWRRESGSALHQGKGRELPLRWRCFWWRIDSWWKWLVVRWLLWFPFQRFNVVVDS